MSDGQFPSLVSKDRAVNAVTNPIFVELTDGTNAVNVTSNALDVNITTASVTVDLLSEFVDDSAFGIGTGSISVSGFLADETTPDSVDEGDVGAARMTLDRKQLFVLVDATTDANRLAIDASGLAQVDVAAHALTNANALPISKDNAANAELNPLYVYNVNTVTSGNEQQDYEEEVDIASDASANHDYTVAGTTFLLKQIIVSGSGSYKYEVQVGAIAALATVMVGFSTGRQGDTDSITFAVPIEVPATGTGTVRVVVTNRQGTAVSIYSTIIGSDVA